MTILPTNGYFDTFLLHWVIVLVSLQQSWFMTMKKIGRQRVHFCRHKHYRWKKVVAPFVILSSSLKTPGDKNEFFSSSYPRQGNFLSLIRCQFIFIGAQFVWSLKAKTEQNIYTYHHLNSWPLVPILEPLPSMPLNTSLQILLNLIYITLLWLNFKLTYVYFM